ncbi:MAG: bacterial Ig-like domain-containing protein [Clostridiales bacterium]|nr:bacterial Ig-like domain-containing protein [Clostridiales bacterium]
MKKLFSLIVSLVLVLAAVPSFVLADNEDLETVTVPPVEVNVEDDLADPDDLLAGYEEKIMYPQPLRRRAWTVGSGLDGINATMYTLLSSQIREVAAGNRASTHFVFSVAELGYDGVRWYEDDLGMPVVSGGAISNAAMTAIGEDLGYDGNRIVKALLADLPYELYWFDKTTSCTFPGYSVGGRYDYDREEYYLYITGNFEVYFPVSVDYDAGSYVFDTSIGKAIQNIPVKAASIVSQYASLSDYGKLSAYKEAICDLVSYNHNTASLDYGDPWQIIWVFDEDPSTNVVCEGYSKAFKYLCDLSDFRNDISCILSSGNLICQGTNGGHMWNIMRMEDGKNYIVDVTNCDSDSVGYPDKLFMTGASGSVSSGYTVMCGSTPVQFKYKTETTNTFPTELLTISSSVYTPPSEVNLVRVSLKTLPIKIEYQVGEDDLDVTGGKVLLVYSDDTREEVDLTEDMVSGFDTSRSRMAVLTVTSNGFRAHYSITVTAKATKNESYGWKCISGQWYYIGSDGVALKGWQDLYGRRYYFGDDGVRRTGWQTIDGKQYYFNPEGDMVRGKVTIDGQQYAFGADGARI